MNATKRRRAARVGDIGTVRSWIRHGGCGELVIETETEIVTVMGDWRPISQIAAEQRDQEVEVCEGAEAMFPVIRPLVG